MQALIAHYITLRLLHAGFVAGGGSLFALRALAALACQCRIVATAVVHEPCGPLHRLPT